MNFIIDLIIVDFVDIFLKFFFQKYFYNEVLKISIFKINKSVKIVQIKGYLFVFRYLFYKKENE